MNDAALLVEVTRNGVVESRHRGHLVVVDVHGRELASVGEPGMVTYFRSAAKPVQALAVVMSGAADRYGLSDAELAVICSSHYAEDAHRLAVTSILRKIGLTPDALRGGVVRSLNADIACQQAWNHLPLAPTFSDCSGKHAGMLAVCRHRNWDTATYLNPDHPVQHRLGLLTDDDRSALADYNPMPVTNDLRTRVGDIRAVPWPLNAGSSGTSRVTPASV